MQHMKKNPRKSGVFLGENFATLLLVARKSLPNVIAKQAKSGDHSRAYCN